jgi:hypothetical protein
LKAELKKYHDSKKESENGQRIYIWRTWNNDLKNMYTLFNASKILSDIHIEMKWLPML